MTVGGVGSTNQADAGAARNDQLLKQAKDESGSRDKEKIEKAGHDFESLLLGQWLTSAQKSFAAAPGSGDDDGGDDDSDDGGSDQTNDQYTSMAMQHVADSLVKQGGIGLSRMIVEHLEAAAEHKKGAVKDTGETGAKKAQEA